MVQHVTEHSDMNMMFLKVSAKCDMNPKKTSSHFAAHEKSVVKASQEREAWEGWACREKERHSGLGDQQVQSRKYEWAWFLQPSLCSMGLEHMGYGSARPFLGPLLGAVECAWRSSCWKKLNWTAFRRIICRQIGRQQGQSEELLFSAKKCKEEGSFVRDTQDQIQ